MDTQGQTSGVQFAQMDRIYVTVWPEVVDRAMLAAHLERCDRCLAEGKLFALLLDVRAMKTFGARERATAAEWERTNHAALADNLVGMAMVVSNLAMAAIMTAMNWMAPPPFPKKMFTSRQEAETWVRDRLREADRRRAAAS